MAPLPVTFSDLEGHFCCLKPLCPSATVVLVHNGAVTSTTSVIITLVDHSHYGPVDITKIDYTEVC